MAIRSDLSGVEGLISRLLSIGNEFRSKDSWWSHLKNNEDWDRIYRINDHTQLAKIERIYSDGRDMALFMSDELISINSDFTTYPTLTSIIERINATWVYEDIESILTEAAEAQEQLGLRNWAFSQMLGTFREQMGLVNVVRKTLELMKESDLYKLENGIPMEKNKAGAVTIEGVTNSNISIHSQDVTQSVSVNTAVFAELIKAIESSGIQAKEPLIVAVEKMADDYSKGSWLSSYKEFVELAANHMTVFGPFLPQLAALL